MRRHVLHSEMAAFFSIAICDEDIDSDSQTPNHAEEDFLMRKTGILRAVGDGSRWLDVLYETPYSGLSRVTE